MIVLSARGPDQIWIAGLQSAPSMSTLSIEPIGTPADIDISFLSSASILTEDDTKIYYS